ncbi:Pr6Pr family membrane protein [Microbacterium sp. NPDC055683]
MTAPALADDSPARMAGAWARGWQVLRVAAAVLLLAAVAAQFADSYREAQEATEPYAAHLPTVVANFFSFFTIDSNISSAVVLLLSAVAFWRGRETRVRDVLLACVSTYMIITGIVYNTLLRGIESTASVVPWSNEVLHVVGPLFLLADVLLAPRRRALPWTAVWAIVSFPVVWAVYTLLRANAITSPGTGNPWWYPYPFLDPHLQGGYGGVALYIIGIAVAMALVGSGVVGVSRLRARS